MTTSLFVAFLAILLVLGFIAWRACVRAEKADWLLGAACSDVLDLLAVRSEDAADLLELHGDLEDAQDALAEARQQLDDQAPLMVAAEAHITALRGELYRQTMSELTSAVAQESVGRSNVIEMPTGRAR